MNLASPHPRTFPAAAAARDAQGRSHAGTARGSAAGFAWLKIAAIGLLALAGGLLYLAGSLLVALYVLDNGTANQLGSLDAQGFADPVERVQQLARKPDVDLLGVGLRPLFLRHGEHAGGSYQFVASNPSFLRRELANAVDYRIILAVGCDGSREPIDLLAERTPLSGQGWCAMQDDEDRVMREVDRLCRRMPRRALDNHEYDLRHEVEQLNELVRRRLPQGNVVRDYFDAAFAGLKPGEMADIVTVERARVAFYRLMTGWEQRRILNGWTPVADRPSRIEVLGTAMDCEAVERVMLIEATPRVATSCHDVVLTWGTAPVLIRVREGARSGEVLAALHRAIELVNEQWSSIVADMPMAADDDEEDAAQEEGDAPDTFHTPMIGVSKGAKAMSPTAA